MVYGGSTNSTLHSLYVGRPPELAFCPVALPPTWGRLDTKFGKKGKQVEIRGSKITPYFAYDRVAKPPSWAPAETLLLQSSLPH